MFTFTSPCRFQLTKRKSRLTAIVSGDYQISCGHIIVGAARDLRSAICGGSHVSLSSYNAECVMNW